MKLLTKRLRERLLRNGKNRGQDHPPAVKFFHPCGAATWLFSELDEDGDTLWGLAYLGGGAPELGYSSLCQLGTFRGRFGLGIERDRHFRPKYGISIYTQAARDAGRIVEYGPDLDAAAERLAAPPAHA